MDGSIALLVIDVEVSKQSTMFSSM